MDRQRFPLILGACAVALVTGCAQTGPTHDSLQGVEVEPVYRVEQPVGTAAGQYAAGRIDLGEGRYESAILRFRQALLLEPGFAAAHNGLGIAYGYTGRFKLAVEAFRAALASGPSSAHVLNNLGFAQLKAGRLDLAQESLRRSLERDPGNAGTAANIRLLELLRQAPSVAEPGVVRQGAAGPEISPRAHDEQGRQASDDAVQQEAASGEHEVQSLPVPHAHVMTALTQAHAARVLGEKPNSRAYEIVASRVTDTALVEVTSNVYEVHFGVRSPSSARADAEPAPVTGSKSVGLPVSRGVPRSPWQSVEPAALSSPPKTGSIATAGAGGPRTMSSQVIVTAIPLRVTERAHPPGRGSAEPEGSPFVPVAASFPRDLPMLATATGGPPGTAADLEVSNGVGLRHLAARTAMQLKQGGARVTRLSNHPGFGVRQSEIHYREGNLAAARALERWLPVRVKLVPAADLHSNTTLRLVVGRDMVVGPITGWNESDVRRPTT